MKHGAYKEQYAAKRIRVNVGNQNICNEADKKNANMVQQLYFAAYRVWYCHTHTQTYIYICIYKKRDIRFATEKNTVFDTVTS